MKGNTKNVDSYNSPNIGKYVEVSATGTFGFTASPPLLIPTPIVGFYANAIIEIGGSADGTMKHKYDPSKTDPVTKESDLSVALKFAVGLSLEAGAPNYCSVELGGKYQLEVKIAQVGLEYNSLTEKTICTYGDIGVTGNGAYFITIHCGFEGTTEYIPELGSFEIPISF